jgi:hypothetical protein
MQRKRCAWHVQICLSVREGVYACVSWHVCVLVEHCNLRRTCVRTYIHTYIYIYIYIHISKQGVTLSKTMYLCMCAFAYVHVCVLHEIFGIPTDD